LYKTNNFIGKIKSSSEGKVFWTELSKLKLLKLADGMDELVKIFLQPNLSEQFLYQENSRWKSRTQ
jgi:8-oxo-dGTP diphosphatase